jgi:predicted enzyme related to lactoylglutathione lyase
MTDRTEPLFKKIDCVQVPVPSVEEGIAFYGDRLGHEVRWRTEHQAGLRLGDCELVVQAERPRAETDLLVESVDDAAAVFVAAGGKVLVDPFDIPVGRVVIVADPFGNPLTLLDLSKGTYTTDADRHVTGVSPPTTDVDDR